MILFDTDHLTILTQHTDMWNLDEWLVHISLLCQSYP
jgi:hypothetical protein